MGLPNSYGGRARLPAPLLDIQILYKYPKVIPNPTLASLKTDI